MEKFTKYQNNTCGDIDLIGAKSQTPVNAEKRKRYEYDRKFPCSAVTGTRRYQSLQ
jgi:hypothetical protein